MEAAIFALGAALLMISARRRVLHRAERLRFGMAAGALFGVSDIVMNYLTHADGPHLGLLSPWTLTALMVGVIAFYASAPASNSGRRPSASAMATAPASSRPRRMLAAVEM